MSSYVASLAVFLGLVTVACGGKDAPPPVVAGEEPQVAAPSVEMADAEAPPSAEAQPTAATDTPAATPAASEPSSDDCTPVGVDFEKRARPKLKECYREGKKKDPNLEGTIRLTVAINFKGQVTNMKIVESTLPDPVGSCMLKVLKATPLPEASKCPDKNITIPMTFPTN